MTLFEKLQTAGLPVISATENGQVIMGAMAPEQEKIYNNIMLEHFQAIVYAEMLENEVDIQALKDDYVVAMTRFDTIVARETTTTANLISDGKFLAKAFKQLLKLIRRGYNGV